MLIRNLLYLSGAEIASKVATFAAIAYLARMIGPAGFGYIEIATAVLMCASLVVDQGFGSYGAREIAKAPEQMVQLVSEITSARAVLALIAYALVITYALLFNDSAELIQLLLIYGLSLLASPLLLQWVFQGHSKMQTVGVMQLIRQSVFAAVIFGFLRDESKLWIAAIAELAGVCSAVAYGLWMYRHQLQGKLQRPVAFTANLLREGIPIGLSQTFWMMRMFGVTVLLGLVAPVQDVGLFGSAMRILIALHAFVWLYFFNLLPSLSKSWKRDDGSFAHLIATSLHAVAWVGATSTLIWILIAPTVISRVYGSTFAPAGSVLQWLVGVFFAAALSGHYRFGLIAAGRQTAEMIIQAVGTAAALFLVPLGYRSSGSAGAAMGLAAAEVLVWLLSWWWARRLLGLDNHSQLLTIPAMAMAVTLGVLWLVQSWSLPIQIVIAIILLITQALTLDAPLRRHLQQGVTRLPHSVGPVH